MEDAETAQSFVEKLANDLLRLGQIKSFDKAVIWEYFDTNVVQLEDVNPELMSFLTENRQAYGKKLVKLAKSLARSSCNMQTALSSGQKSDAHPLPYNLYASNKVKKRTVQEHYSNQCSIYSAYLSERMVHLEDSKAVLKLLKRCLNSSVSSVQRSWLQEIRKLCAVASTRTEPKVLQLVMEIFNMRLSSELECRTYNEECLSDVISSVEDFVTFCLRKHEQVGEFPKKPRFCDLLAATMSMYSDVVLLRYRNKSESDQEKEGKKLCGSICYIFRDYPEFILDVVIQLSECQSSDGMILVPLYKRALAKPVGNVDSVFYTKYIVASCQCRRLFPELMSDVIAQVRDVAAPADYVNWLKEKNSSIPEVFPAKKHFSDSRITKFLLEKATDDLLNKLLDVLTDANVVTEEKLDFTQMTSENHADEMFFFDRALSSENAGFLQEEEMEIAEPENDEEPVDVEDQGGMISFDDKAVPETEIVIRFDRGSATSPETLKEHKKKTRSAEQEKLVGDGLGEEAGENDDIKSQQGIMEDVDVEIDVEQIDENTTSSEEVVEREIERVNEVASGVHKTDPVAVEISDESEDEEVLINRVLDCIREGDTSDSDLFEEWYEISPKKIASRDKKVMREVEGTFVEGDLNKVLETSEQSNENVETECGNKDFEGKVVEAEMGELTFEKGIIQEDSKNHENDVELTSTKLKDETEICAGSTEAKDKIRSPHSGNTSPAKSKSKRKSADHVTKCAKEKTISDANNTYTMLKSGDRTPEKPKKGQEKNLKDSYDEISMKSPKNRCENRDKKEVEDCATDSAVFPSQSEVKIPMDAEKVISTQSKTLDCLKSQNHSFVEPKQLRRSKSSANSLHLPSAWSSKHDCKSPQSPTVTLDGTIVADSSERCTAKSPKNLTNSRPRLPDFKKFLKSPGKTEDVYEFNSDIDKSPSSPYTRLTKRKDSEHVALSPTKPMEKEVDGCKIVEGATGSRSSESPEVFPVMHTYSRGGKRGTVRKDPLPDLEDVKQNEISDVVESFPSTPAKSERGTHDADGRSGSEDPDGHLMRRRSARIQNKLSNAAKDCTLDVPSSPVVNSRKRKASASMETPKKLKT